MTSHVPMTKCIFFRGVKNINVIYLVFQRMCDTKIKHAYKTILFCIIIIEKVIKTLKNTK